MDTQEEPVEPTRIRHLRFLRAFAIALFLAALLLAAAPWVFVVPAAAPWARELHVFAPYLAGLFFFAAYVIVQWPSGDHRHHRTALVLFWAGAGALILHGLQTLIDDPRFLVFGRPVLVLMASAAVRVRAVAVDPLRPTRILIDLAFGYAATAVVVFLIAHLGWTHG